MENNNTSLENEKLQKKDKKFIINWIFYLLVFYVILEPFISLFFNLFIEKRNKLDKVDLQTLKDDIIKIQKSYKKLENIINKIIEDENYRWKLYPSQKELLKEIGSEEKSSNILFLIIGSLWDLIKIILLIILGITLGIKKDIFYQKMKNIYNTLEMIPTKIKNILKRNKNNQ